jgi:hypothetical protein
MTADAPGNPRQRYDALASNLSTRRSTLHFAHAGVAVVLAIIFAGTAGRIFWKAEAEMLPFGWVAGLAAALAVTYALVRLFIGRSQLRAELSDFAQLQSLRQQLGLDDPARLMPR